MPNPPNENPPLLSGEISLDYGQHMIVAGQTGSGKSTFAREFLRDVGRLIAIDPQDSLDDWGLEPYSSDALKRLDNGEPVRIQAVPPIGKVGAAQFYEEVFTRAFETPPGNVIVYVDEIFAVVDANKDSSALRAIWTRGRKAGISGVATTQRPTFIPLILLSEAQHFVMFRLFLEDDRRRMRQMMGDNVMRGIPPETPFGFWYRQSTWAEAQFHPGLVVKDADSPALELAEFAE